MLRVIHPLDAATGAAKMNYNVFIEIRENSTGIIVGYPDNIDLGSENCFFIWEEGNYSCDCNRHTLFFMNSNYEGFIEDFPCGDEAYSVNIWSPNKTILLYSEF